MDISELYKAEATTPFNNSISFSTRAGFRIPEYQRQYDWSEENIERLYTDTLNGLNRVKSSHDSSIYTFLGSIIMVEEKSVDPDFEGVSLSIVDGQQRLTTLSLFACAIYEKLKAEKSKEYNRGLRPEVSSWLEKELEHLLGCLYYCVLGVQQIPPSYSYPYPRIVRSEDIRGKNLQTSDYKSPIACLFFKFSNYVESSDTEYNVSKIKKLKGGKKVFDKYQYIRKLLNNLNNPEWYDDTDSELFDVRNIERKQVRSLFSKLESCIPNQSDQNKALSELTNSADHHDFIRSLLFARYFCDYIVFTKVVTQDEGAAFDIFDALNTTGEPLTALETLKPRVLQFENRHGKFAGSESEQAWVKLDELIEQRFLDTKIKQAETKELVVLFALYQEGEKLSKELAGQRNFLRNSFDAASDKDLASARAYMASFAKLAEFKRYYFENDGIEELSRFHKGGNLDLAQLLASFLKNMKTTMALPLLCRYWSSELKTDGDKEFLDVFKATVAFLVLRRAFTGTTDGVDGVFRDLMAIKSGNNKSQKFGFCISNTSTRYLPSVNELKTIYTNLLTKKIKHLNKENWVNHVSENPLYKQSKQLVRFLTFAAADFSSPSSEAGLLSREGVKKDYRRSFLNYMLWSSDLYATVEHVAPESEKEGDWDRAIYRNQITRHTLGNLTLLPSKENSSIGNASWEKKRLFYSCLTSETHEEHLKRLELARKQGVNLSKSLLRLLESGDLLPLLIPVQGVDKWNKELIEKRSRNIAELAWDKLWPWVNPDDS
ncbi:MAG: hypothetical protein CMF22_12680 [Idiomarinaceae bacterium]|nr:hypothetical protein [Idiomarinaceae bacterium]MBG24291.1 hypothetical protein [Idiomarinaceae bacterium]|tara:strand:- start:13114 stop:15432 length:2319 start_codon:yes stop_codon:yes gene_type:complete